jgi:hypothetical protein
MMDQWNCEMMGLKKTEFKAHIFALIFCSDAVFVIPKGRRPENETGRL